MAHRFSAFVILSALALTGCAAMEQYHFPQTQDKVPVEVIVGYSDKHPNEVIKSITEEKMYDGTKRYQFEITDTKNNTRTVTFSEKGDEIPGAM